MAAAKIDVRAEKLFIRSMRETNGGAHIVQDDPVMIDAHDISRVGEAVRAALQLYQVGAPMPSQFSLDAPSVLYTMAGVKNWREFAKGAKSVSVREENGRITLTPYKNEWPRLSFVPIRGRDKIVASTSSNAELGAAIIAAVVDAV